MVCFVIVCDCVCACWYVLMRYVRAYVLVFVVLVSMCLLICLICKYLLVCFSEMLDQVCLVVYFGDVRWCLFACLYV